MRHPCMECYCYFWTLNVITFLAVQTMIHLQRRIRELHCAFSINFYICVLGEKENMYLHGKSKICKSMLDEPSLFEIFLSKRGKNMAGFTKKMCQTKYSSTLYCFSANVWLILMFLWRFLSTSTSSFLSLHTVEFRAQTVCKWVLELSSS